MPCWVRMETDRIRMDMDSDISNNHICVSFQFPSLRMKTDRIRIDTDSNISNIFEYSFFCFLTVSILLLGAKTCGPLRPRLDSSCVLAVGPGTPDPVKTFDRTRAVAPPAMPTATRRCTGSKHDGPRPVNFGDDL